MAPPRNNFDLLVRHATIVDGHPDRPPVRGDIAVTGGRIAAIGDLSEAVAAREIDAAGLTAAPGFIDVHTHTERALLGGPHRYAAAGMGVTTVLSAPDGFGWTGLDTVTALQLWESTTFANGPGELPRLWRDPRDYLADFVGVLPINLVPQAPHQALRAAAARWGDTPVDRGQLGEQVRQLEAWYEVGAVGLCLGLDYLPGALASYEELRALAEVTAAHGGVVAAHLRYNVLGRHDAWLELMRLNRDTGVKVHVSHEAVTDSTTPLLARCDDEGIDLSFESYLYPAGCTHLSMMLPLELQLGPPEALAERLHDDGARKAITAELAAAFTSARDAGERIVTVATPSGRHVGVDLLAAAGADPQRAARNAVAMMVDEFPFVLALYHRGWNEAEREEIFAHTAVHPRMVVASDGIYHGRHGHPRSYGCFPRFVRRFVRERGLLTLPQAVHRMAGAPADRFGIPDRGYLEVGRAADLLLFDADTVRDEATWQEPFAPPTGIEAVLVAGQEVVLGGSATGALPGRVLGRA